MLYVQLSDPNLDGYVPFKVEDRDELDRIMHATGSWQNLPESNGAVLLSNPQALVYLTAPDGQDPYPDFIVELDEDDATVWGAA